MRKKIWKIWAVCLMLLLAVSGMTVFASASDDNSLSDLGIENAVSVTPDFEYSTTEYEIEVPEGTEELLLNPVTSNGAASYEISGQTLTDGETTVYITVTAESGMQAVYTLYVQAERPNAAAQIAAANETTTPETEVETEKQTETEEVSTEVETETVSEAAARVKQQVEKLKSDADFSMKVIYALIALSVVLLFALINLILKNRDLKDDLRDAEEKLDMQTNEFARKERYLATENYYAPIQQQAVTGVKPQEIPTPQPVQETPEPQKTEAPAEIKQEVKPARDVSKRKAKKEKKKVDVKMIDL